MLLMVEKGIRWGIYHSVYSDSSVLIEENF